MWFRSYKNSFKVPCLSSPIFFRELSLVSGQETCSMVGESVLNIFFGALRKIPKRSLERTHWFLLSAQR